MDNDSELRRIGIGSEKSEQPRWRYSLFNHWFVCSWRGHDWGKMPAIVPNPYALLSLQDGCLRCGTPRRYDSNTETGQRGE